MILGVRNIFSAIKTRDNNGFPPSKGAISLGGDFRMFDCRSTDPLMLGVIDKDAERVSPTKLNIAQDMLDQ